MANANSGIDVDKWDYFERDATSTGLPRDFDTWSVYSQYLQPFQPKAGLPKGGGLKKTVPLHYSLIIVGIDNVHRRAIRQARVITFKDGAHICMRDKVSVYITQPSTLHIDADIPVPSNALHCVYV